MSLKSRCIERCNDCHGKTPWKFEYIKPGRESHSSGKYCCDKCEEKVSPKPKCPSSCPPPCPPHAVNSACGVISVKNPLTELVIPELLIGNVSSAANVSVVLAGWTDIITDVSDAFNNFAGTYTPPTSGDYEVNLVVNYETSVPLSVSSTLIDVPSIELFDVTSGLKIVGSTFPATSQIITIPPLSSGALPIDILSSGILAKAQVVISVIVPLVEGNPVAIRANTNGLVYSPPFIGPVEVLPTLPPRIVFDPENVDTVLTIKKIRNTPIVTIHCNN